MEEQKSNAGQGLGIAGLILGILAIPMGLVPCTFYMGIIFGIIGIVLSVVALSQAKRGYGPRALIIAALVCSIIGLSFASVWGFAFSRNGARVVREMVRDGIRDGKPFEGFTKDAKDVLNDLENDTAHWNNESPDDLKHLTDTLKMLEGEPENPE